MYSGLLIFFNHVALFKHELTFDFILLFFLPLLATLIMPDDVPVKLCFLFASSSLYVLDY
jgi:hypothetical protein